MLSDPLGSPETFGSETIGSIATSSESPTQRDDGAPREALLLSGRLRLPIENNNKSLNGGISLVPSLGPLSSGRGRALIFG